jgi:hypothetical protein
VSEWLFLNANNKINIILCKYSMWMWSIYKNIFQRYHLQYNTFMQFKVPKENVRVYWSQSHRIFVIIYFNSKIINQIKKKINKCKLTYNRLISCWNRKSSPCNITHYQISLNVRNSILFAIVFYSSFTCHAHQEI